MKILFALIIIASGVVFSFAQNEQSPMVEKEIGYKDWTYKNLKGGGETNLRQFAKGKKLVMVVYWAPWCHNWAHDVGFVQELHQKYAKDGLAVIGVAEYDPVDKMKQNYEQNKLTFPSVYEAAASAERLNTVHYAQRTAAGDTRKWGSPWYVFLDPATIQSSGDVVASKVQVVNGELIRPDAEKFIREKLGLATASPVASVKSKEIEVCEPDAKGPTLVKP
ncbi:MAG: redoxin domain-containing protein [Acidobacteria bacterium]|nr:redoxin domain-containing protein [Acidobacteriota bacterium]